MAFFATCHGKNACDCVGGTVKRLAAYASLQRPLADQIITPKQLFEFCKKEITIITSFYISRIDIEINKSFLHQRYNGFKTISGTRSHHSFVPSKNGKLSLSRVSDIAHKNELHPEKEFISQHFLLKN